MCVEVKNRNKLHNKSFGTFSLVLLFFPDRFNLLYASLENSGAYTMLANKSFVMEDICSYLKFDKRLST